MKLSAKNLFNAIKNFGKNLESIRQDFSDSVLDSYAERTLFTAPEQKQNTQTLDK